MKVESERIRDLYERSIRQLSVAERLELLALLAEDLVLDYSRGESALHDVMEFRGMGKEIWAGIDAQEYVNQLRDEWEKPST